MRILDATGLPDRMIGAHGSTGFTLGHVGYGVHAIIVRLDAGGRIGRHPAVRAQLLIPLAGHALVSGDAAAAPVEIRPGEAVLWDGGESHETTTQNGLTAVILEGDEIADLR
ncbi:hypothetical protein ACLBXX_19065 [Microbacterium sp. C23T]